MKKQTILILLFLILSATKAKSFTDSMSYFPLPQVHTFLHVADQSLMLEDPTNQLSSKEVLHDDSVKSLFKKQQMEIPNFGFTSSTFWFKLNLQNHSTEEQEIYMEVARPLTNKVNLHIFDENGQLLKKYKTGDERIFAERSFWFRNFIFPIVVEPNEKLQFLLEVGSDGEVVSMPIKLWKQDYFLEFINKENFFLGMFYGLLCFVVLLFSFFGFALKQRLYAYFVTYVAFVVLMQLSLDGLAFQFLWPNSPWLASHAVVILATVSIIALLYYVRTFLDFKDFPRSYVKAYNIFLSLLFICLILSFLQGKLYELSFPIVNLLAFLSSFLFLIGIYFKYKKAGKINPYFLLAFLSVLSGGVIFVLSNSGAIQSDFLLSNALKMGTGLEVIFLSIAMASQYREVEASKVEAQKLSMENLEQLAELKLKQNVILEKQVSSRTQELSESNKKLSKKNSEIIESITYAQRLQDAVLPKQEDLNKLFEKSFVLHLPKDIVSGDFYWAEKIDESIYFAVADCTGHGVPGAMLSVLGHNSLNRCVTEFNLTKPSEILDKLTELIEHTLGQYDKTLADGMDIALCKWNGAQKLEYAGANNPIYIVSDDGLNEIKGDKQPIGNYFKRKKFTNHELEIKSNSYIYLSTDGFADQFGGLKDKKYMYGKLKKLLLEINNKNPIDQKDILKEAFQQWKNNAEQVDDVCILGVGL